MKCIVNNNKIDSCCLSTKLIQNNQYMYPILMWFICTLFYGFQYFVQVSPGVMVNNLMRDLQINATVMGNLAACYFYAYAPMQIPVGIILDKFQAKKPLTIACLVCAIGCFLFAVSHSFYGVAFGRLLFGIGAAFPVIGGMYIASHWLPSKIYALLIGCQIVFGTIGAICAQMPLAFAVNSIGWRSTVIMLSCIGLCITILLFFVIKDKKEEKKLTPEPAEKKILTGLKFILKNKQIWLLAIYGGLMFMPISVFGSLWGVPFLEKKYNIPNTEAGKIISMLFFGLMVGSPLFGWLSDFIKRRNVVMLIGAVGALISVIFIIYFPLTQTACYIALFIYSFFTGCSFVCYSSAKELDKTNSTGTNMGFVNMLNMIGGAVIQPLVGFMLDLRWDGATKAGIRIYSLTNFKIALTLIPIAILISLFVLKFIKETNCRHVDIINGISS